MDSTPTRTAVLNTALLKTRLQAIKSGKTAADDIKQNVNICVICLEQVTEEAQAQPCSHSQFDFICLASWLQERSSCPLCNAEVSTIRYGLGDNGEHKEYAVKSTLRSTSVTPSEPSSQLSRTIRQTRPRRPCTTRPTMHLNSAVERRRRVYRDSLYSLHIGSNPISRYREFTPHIFAQSPDLQSRARKWMRRELRVFEYLFPAPSTSSTTFISNPTSLPSPTATKPDRRANNAEFLLEYIIAILKMVDIQGPSGQAIEMLKEFLGREHAKLFLHELRQWLRSPYEKVEEWDGSVQYEVSGQRGAGYGEAARPGEGVGFEDEDGDQGG